MKNTAHISLSLRKGFVPAVLLAVTGILLLVLTRSACTHHYQDGMSSLAAGSIDTNEFAPGHPNVKMTALQQLRSFPSPRYSPQHKLLRNVQWMAVNYFAGAGQEEITNKQIVDTSVAIQLELATNWHYYLLLPGNTKGSPKQYTDSTTLSGAWIKLANDHPELPASVITFWAQLNPKIAGFSSTTPYIIRRDLPEQHYLPAAETGKGRRKLHPAAPLDSFRQDGLTQRYLLEKLLASLKRPIDLINENGEIFSPYNSVFLENDPVAIADMKRLDITDLNTYQAYGRARIECAYRDAFMSLPGLSNTVYTEYAIDGHSTYREQYSEVRKINYPINKQYYATPDFYPRWPSNWETWKGAWHGIKWITDSRKNEIALGDELFSPYVAAGWDNNEENNIRPAQWLGLLKALGMMGAEFYYTGFFNLQKPYANPTNYAWQAVMPGYAQAITSRYEDILRNGILTNEPGYRYNTGNSNELVIVRKHKTLPIYAITGTIQANSNTAGETPLETITSIKLDGKTLKFRIRRQGSTYLYDLSDAAHPVFVQLDGWHEASHPARWSKGFMFEAEVNDGHSAGCITGTETAASAGDYSDFTSYITFTGKKDTLSFIAEPRITWKVDYYVWVRARVKKGPATLSISTGNTKGETAIKNTSWKWYRISFGKQSLLSMPQGRSIIKLSTNDELEIDKLFLSLSGQEP